ncbi:MAG: preprotein translocase subunit SecG [Anaerolinea sp.]|nr:preprotein translocase subunit SecG [Anaerolinea sp.]
MDQALQVVSIIVSVVLVILVLLQAKGSGLGNLLGGGDSGGGITRTRRGLEKTLFQITVVLSFVFLMVAILSFALNR